jgi:hypothetical protein
MLVSVHTFVHLLFSFFSRRYNGVKKPSCLARLWIWKLYPQWSCGFFKKVQTSWDFGYCHRSSHEDTKRQTPRSSFARDLPRLLWGLNIYIGRQRIDNRTDSFEVSRHPYLIDTFGEPVCRPLIRYMTGQLVLLTSPDKGCSWLRFLVSVVIWPTCDI